jgi:16S rRNA (guanine527-N7)-methyltransferase
MNELTIDPAWRGPLAKGIAELGLEVSAEQQEKLLAYIALLHKWNRAFNLTSVRNPIDMIQRHLLDSLAVSPYLQGHSILDVGTGPGLPGIPLAILFPEKAFTLLDSNGKKTRFVRQSVLELGLKNVQVKQARVEALESSHGFDTITSRAFAPLNEIVSLTQGLLAGGGRLLAMKGRYPEEELAAVDPSKWNLEVALLEVPHLEGERHAVIVTLVAD